VKFVKHRCDCGHSEWLIVSSASTTVTMQQAVAVVKTVMKACISVFAVSDINDDLMSQS